MIRHYHNQPAAILIYIYLAGWSSLALLAVIHRRQAGQIEGRGTVKYAQRIKNRRRRRRRRRSHRRRRRRNRLFLKSSVVQRSRFLRKIYTLLHKRIRSHHTPRVSFVYEGLRETSSRAHANAYHISSAAMTRHEVRDDESLSGDW